MEHPLKVIPLRTARELIEAGQYEQIAALLGAAQLASEQQGDPTLSGILAATLQVCLACNQWRDETELLGQVLAEADQQEQMLKRRLYTLLDLATEHSESIQGTVRMPLPDLPTPGVPRPGAAPGAGPGAGLWQRLRRRLREHPGPAPAAAPEALVAPPPPTLPAPPAAPEAGSAPPPPLPAPTAPTPVALPAAPPVPPVPAEAAAEPPPAPTGTGEEGGGPSVPTLAIYCLGLFQVYHDDQLITDWRSLKGLAILKYLIAHHGTTVTKDTLMDVFWPNADAEAARRNLHQALYSLRQVLKQGRPDFQHILFENDCYFLNPALRIWIDVAEFEMRVEASRRLESADAVAAAMAEYSIAESLYQGDFLEEDPYEDWPQQQREHLRNLYLDVADHLTAYLLEQGDYVAVIALCQKILSCDHYHEEAYRRLMQCYIARGQRHLAIRQYQMCVKALGELDLTPTEETLALYQYLLTHQ